MDKKIALVTGGVGGIGTAICRKLAEEGRFVVANYAIPGSEDRWKQSMAAAGLNGTSSALAFGDVTDFDAMGRMIEDIAANYGKVDILINCAGITRDAQFRKMTPANWHAVIDTNLTSVFNVTRHVIDGMIERGWGRIITLSSVNAVRGQFGQTNYAAAKAGLHGATKSLALELASRGITVNAIAPGIIASPMSDAAFPKAMIDQLVPMKRAGTPEEVADLAGYLASERAGYISGQIISINRAMI
jgi:acetoacetyl-CoA reductase